MTNLIKITEIEQEPRIQDIVLGRALGLQRSRAIRQVIDQNMAELLTYGRAPLVMADVKIGCATRKTESYYLNEPQALLICMFSRTDKAAEVRKEVIQAYMALKHPQNNLGLIPVSSYTRRLPSGPREIKLSDKARSEIGGIVKACIGSALKDITVTQTVDPIGYNIPESLKQPDVVPAEVEKELWRLTEQLHYGLQKQQPKAQNTSVLNLFYLLRALKTVLTRYRTVQNETLFAVDMMKGDKNYEKDEALERIYILNALTNGALRVC